MDKYQEVWAVLDLVYGEEGSPGLRIFASYNDAMAEVQRLLAEDPEDGTYLVIGPERVVIE